MSERLVMLWVSLLVFLWLGTSAQADSYVHGHIIVQMQSGHDVNEVDDDYNTSTVTQGSDGKTYAVSTPSGTDEPTFVNQLQSDSRVKTAQLDSYLSLPEVSGKHFHFAFQAGPDPGGYINQNAYTQVDWQGGDASGIIVAVLDTGADLNHPALQGAFVPGYNTIVPGTDPWDLPDYFDLSLNLALGHGTMVAGLIAKLAPGVKIMPIRVLDSSGQGTLLSVLNGLSYAVAHGAQVINMSFGTSQPSQALSDALSSAAHHNVVLVASAGNEGIASLDYPAADQNVLAVASVEANHVKSPYSNYGSHIAVVAPGSGIRSTYWDDGYAEWSGTSFSAPFVTAEAALIFAAFPGSESDNVAERIRESAHSIYRANQPFKGMLGHGIIDFNAALLPVFDD